MHEPGLFGAWLRRRRKASDLTQDALAELVYCSPDMIRKIELGSARPSRQLAELIVEHLGISPTEQAAYVTWARTALAVPATSAPLLTKPGQATGRALPLPPTPLIGRSAESAQVCALLRLPGVRLVTCVGPPGIGKTRLAVHAAANLLTEFADGLWFVELAPLTDPSLVANTLAAALGVAEVLGRPVRDQLVTYLHDRHALLVLDNFEHLLAAAELVHALLQAAPGLKVLATSRTPLRVYGEKEYPVPPLRVPESSASNSLAELMQVDAVQLFVERARDVQPDFALTLQTGPAVAEICRRLDGLPLAIELAAARSRLFPPTAMLTRLASRLMLLTGGTPTLPARQQTLRNAIAWSYDLLTPEEQLLFRRMALFHGGGTLEVIAAVCNTDGRLDVLAGVEALVNHNMLYMREGLNGEPRFSMLETIHEYATEQFAATPEAETLRQAYAGYYLALVEAVKPRDVVTLLGAGFQTMAAEHDNLRAVLAWSLARGEVETLLRLAGVLGYFWAYAGHWSEGRKWLAAVLDESRTQESRGLQTGNMEATRAKVLIHAAWLAFLQADLDLAQALQEEALAIFNLLGDTLHCARTLIHLAAIVNDRSDTARARALNAEALVLLHGLGIQNMIAVALNAMGYIAFLAGDVDQAIAHYEEALALYRELDDPDPLTPTALLNGLGMALVERGEYERAQAVLDEGCRLAQQWPIIDILIYYLEGFAWLAAEFGAHRDQATIGACRAARLFGATEALRMGVGKTYSRDEQAIHDRHLAAARAHLDEAVWAARWAEGLAMPVEQAIAYALGDSPEADRA